MTQEEKAKAYDEAVNKIKPLYEQAKRDGNPIWSTYEYLIPELRESEDEKIRRTLVEYFGPKVQLDFVRGIPIQKIRDWLEKKKEPDPSYSETGYPIEDCDYGLEIALDILEKTLGKVQGFQTDDGIREHQTAIKAVKDAKKEQKPLETPSPSVIYTEQGEVPAEQKPIKVYRVENEDKQKGLWRKFDGTWEPLFDILTDGLCRDLPMEDSDLYHEGGKKWFASAPSRETLQKWFSKRDLEELTAAGFTISEFEVTNYKKVSEFEYIFTRDSIINRTYLTVSDIYPEQKPIHTAKEAWKEMRLEVYAQASGNRHEPNYSDDSTKMFSLCDIDEIFEKIGNSTVEQKPAEKQDYSGLNDPERAIHRGFLCAGVENVPVTIIKETAKDCLAHMPAWSEEDTEMYINVASSLRGYACGLENEEHKRHIKKGLDWLENRFKSLRPQPRKEIYQSAKHDLAIKFMNYLDENRPEGKMSLSNGECEDIDKAFKENDWAKIMRYVEKYSPQLKQDWSEEDEKMLTGIIERGSVQVPPYTTALREEQIEWLMNRLKSLRPDTFQNGNSRPKTSDNWKPSEEQMKALQHAIDACESEWAYQDDELRSLLNDLKKL